MAEAARATFAIFEWTPVPDFHLPVKAIDQLIEAVRKDAEDHAQIPTEPDQSRE
jgi:hypothetical protein